MNSWLVMWSCPSCSPGTMKAGQRINLFKKHILNILNFLKNVLLAFKIYVSQFYDSWNRKKKRSKPEKCMMGNIFGLWICREFWKTVLSGQNGIFNNILFWFYKDFQKQMANNDRHERQMALDDESTSPAHYVRAAVDGHKQLFDVCSPQQPIRAA